MRKQDNYKKLDNLRNFIMGWVHEEAGPRNADHLVLGKYNSRRKKLMMIVSTDLEHVNKIIRTHRWDKLTKAEMKKCNTIKKKYLAISNVEFGEK